MIRVNPAQFLATAKRNETLRGQLKAAKTIQSCVEIAKIHGYEISREELRAELDKIPKATLAEIFNPGIAPRHHIKPH